MTSAVVFHGQWIVLDFILLLYGNTLRPAVVFTALEFCLPTDGKVLAR